MGNFCFCFSTSSAAEKETIAQPSQQPIAHTSEEAANVDLERFVQKFNDLSQLHELIHFIEELLETAVSYLTIVFVQCSRE